ncbi:MAG TPA: S41 family peptidase [Thermoanaerobaculia bacterium]|nr:S41 family peptidase [Thermoanaerobaculia bacterium]
MTRASSSRIAFLALSALLVVPLVGSGLARAGSSGQEDDFYKHLSVFTEVLRLVRTVYVEPTDIDMLMAGALDGTTDALDPFSLYVPAEHATGYQRVAAVGRNRSGLLVLKERGVAYLAAVDEQSPGASAGVRRGDILAKIGPAAQERASSRDLPLWRIRQLLAGEPGQKLELEVVRQGEALTVELTLGSYSPPEPRLREVSGVSVLRLASFAPQALRSLDEILARAKAANLPLLVDLRGVAGDDPEQGFEAAKSLTSGELGKLLDRKGVVVQAFRADREPLWTAPALGVLVDRGSQGAAEVFAAVLRQRVGAVVLGEDSFGHAGRTTRVNLSSGAFLELTDAFYSGPDGVRITESLEPDLAVSGIRFATGDDAEEVLERAVVMFVERQQSERAAA